MTLQNTSVLVIGGTSGIGFGVAKAAQEAGAHVTVASRSAEKVAQASTKLGTEGVELDTGDAAMLEGFFAGHSFDHIFCSAASTRVDAVRALPLEDAYGSFDSKFWGAYRVARAASVSPVGR